MKIRIVSLLALFIILPFSLWADIDITDLYLQNAGFDDEKHFDYTTSDFGNVSQEILSIYGWNKDIGVDYTVTGIYQIGTPKTFNTNGKVPSEGYNGSKNGGCLVLSTGWEETLKYYQKANLPAGKYKLQAAFYNGSNSTSGASLLGWIPKNGNSTLSSLSSFSLNGWSLDEVSFSLNSETEGKIQIGFKGAAGGSANSAKVVVDFVKIILVGDNTTLLSNMRSSLKETISSANKAYGNGEGNNATQLKSVIDKAQKEHDSSNATYATLFSINQNLIDELIQYNWANATLSNPSNMTEFIVNNSFEEGFNGWAQNGLQTQSNNSFPLKSGNLYVEKWVSAGSSIGNTSITQTIGSELPKGIYLLKASVQNTQNGQKGQTGAWIMAGNDSIEVSEAKEYTLQFMHMEDQLTIGFVTHNASGNWIAADNFQLYYAAATTDDYKKEIEKRTSFAKQLLNENIGNECMADLSATIEKAEQWISTPNLGTLSNLSVSLRNSTQKALKSLEKAEFREKIENATGPVPSVTTDPRSARGATIAFGRASFSGSNIMEKGFCWSTFPQPTVLDNRSSLSYSNNGDIYVMDGLQPSTLYYIRPYAITKEYAVGYGETIRICTLPMGNVTWSYNNGGSAEENERINQAIGDAVDIWNHLTSIQGLRLSVSYGANTPTADCSYGGSMRVGPNASYQRTGTIQHEMCHGAGVGTTETWYNSAIYRQETSKGFWLGERTDQVVRFLENDYTSQLRGDNTHFWPYGINGAHEDNGTRMLYYANALIIQALGEDFLPPVSGAFASPAYTFAQEDEEWYYLMPADGNWGSPSLLQSTGSGVTLKSNDWKSILADFSYAWRIRFNPATQMYEFRNIESNSALTNYNAQIALESKDQYKLQLLGSRANVVNSHINMKSYWITFSDGSNRPQALTSGNYGVSATRFDHQNSASQQRWIILTRDEIKELAGDYTNTDEMTAEHHSLFIYGGKGEIVFETTSKGEWINIYNVQGEQIDRFYMQAGMYLTKSVQAGIYIINGKKILVK